MKKKSRRFTEALIEANGLHREEFQSWVFASGMLFHSPDKWWGDLGRRDFRMRGSIFAFTKMGPDRRFISEQIYAFRRCTTGWSEPSSQIILAMP